MTETAPTPPAGWYPDPSGAPTQRYWDGGRWTEQLAPLPPPTATPPPVANEQRPGMPAFWTAIAGCAVTVIGVLGPWQTALGGAVSRSGVNETDGPLVLVLIGLVSALLFWHLFSRGYWTARVAVGLGVLCCIDVATNISQVASDSDSVDTGWGLWACAIGALLATAAAVWFLAIVLRSKARAAMPSQREVRSQAEQRAATSSERANPKPRPPLPSGVRTLQEQRAAVERDRAHSENLDTWPDT